MVTMKKEELQLRLSKMEESEILTTLLSLSTGSPEDFEKEMKGAKKMSLISMATLLDLKTNKNIIDPELVKMLGSGQLNGEIDLMMIFPLGRPNGMCNIHLKAYIESIDSNTHKFQLGTFV